MRALRTVWRFCERGVIAIRRHGARGAVARAARRFARRLHAHERHTWYELDLRASRAGLVLPEDVALRPAGDADLAQIAALPEATSVPVMRRLRADGHELWIVDGSGGVAVLCWIVRV